MSEFTTALAAHPEMNPLDVARIHLSKHPDEQTRTALLVVVDLLAHLVTPDTSPGSFFAIDREGTLRLVDVVEPALTVDEAHGLALEENAARDAQASTPPKPPKGKKGKASEAPPAIDPHPLDALAQGGYQAEKSIMTFSEAEKQAMTGKVLP